MGAQGAGPVRSFFEGEATSEVGRKTTAAGDFWTAMQPDLAPLDPTINTADRRLTRIARRVPSGDAQAGRQLGFLQGLAIRAIEQRYLKDPPPANFRVNVNPLVSWIWVGGAIAVLGGLVAIWPAPEARRRRVSDVYAARLARELGRA
jgi:cytochrome c-type biogenesis protein CcmF